MWWVVILTNVGFWYCIVNGSIIAIGRTFSASQGPAHLGLRFITLMQWFSSPPPPPLTPPFLRQVIHSMVKIKSTKGCIAKCLYYSLATQAINVNDSCLSFHICIYIYIYNPSLSPSFLITQINVAHCIHCSTPYFFPFNISWKYILEIFHIRRGILHPFLLCSMKCFPKYFLKP